MRRSAQVFSSSGKFVSSRTRDFKKEYLDEYKRSLEDPDKYWGDVGRSLLSWSRPFHKTSEGSFKDVRYYLGGRLNASYNCIDRHLESGAKKASDCALIWEGDEPTDTRRVSWGEFSEQVNQFSNLLLSLGVRAGDSVVLYMPNCPEALVAMQGCARIGAPHAVVFAGFSAEALRTRVQHVGANVVVTVDGMKRGGRSVPLKQQVDEALLACPDVKNVVVLQREKSTSSWVKGRDINMLDAMSRMRPWCPPEPFDSEHNLFILYTSGSTGAPKGIVHSTAGYLAYVAHAHSRVFDYRPGDIHACVADIGWITGHTFVVYGPLLNGATSVVFEGIPTHPGPDRYWDMVARHKITTFYTSPTALRAVAKFGDEHVTKHDLSSLRVIGCAGEPLNPEIWKWYWRVVGKEKCSIVDTYWQTETGACIITPLANVTPMKPGSATFPFFGVDYDIIKGDGKKLEGPGSGVLVLKRHWPGMCRTVLGDHVKFWNTYFRDYEGHYFTGDGVARDEEGFLTITGRVDDVLKKAGHRIGTAEVENALVQSSSVAEAAVVGIPDEIKGESIVAFCILKAHVKDDISWSDLSAELKQEVRKHVGAIASPDFIVFTDWLPKTRSGKIMRRLLRKVAEGDTSNLGDLSTLNDPPSHIHALIKVADVVIRHKKSNNK